MRLFCRLLAISLVATASLISTLPAFSQAVKLYQWHSVNIQGMGYVTGLVVRPNAPFDVYIRTDVGGAYRYNRTTDSWIPLMDGLDRADTSDIGVESIAIDPGTPKRIYAALNMNSTVQNGLYNHAGDVLVSDDQGANWKSTGFVQKNVYLGPNDAYRTDTGERLAVDPNNPNILYFATRQDGLWKGVRSGAILSWTLVSGLPDPTKLPYYGAGAPGYTFVAFDKSTASGGKTQTIYVGVFGSGVWRTLDAGLHWSLLAGGPDSPARASIGIDKTLYVSFADDNGGNGRKVFGAVYAYAKNAWKDISPADENSGYTGITADPVVANTVMVARGGQVYRSTNAGAHWTTQSLNLRAPAAKAPGYYTNDEAGVSNGVAAMCIDPSNVRQVWWTNGWGVTRTDNVAVANPVWNWHMTNLEELVTLKVRVPTKPKAQGGADLVSAVNDVLGFRHTSRTVVPPHKHNPGHDPVPFPGTTNASDIKSFDQQYLNWGNGNYPGGVFPIPFPHVTGVTGLDFSYHNSDLMAFVGFHQWQTVWPIHGYSTDGGQTWTGFASVPQQKAASGADTLTFFGSGGDIALSPVIPTGHTYPNMVWVPTCATFGNPWWNTTYTDHDARIPWPSVSVDGGKTWQTCHLKDASQQPNIGLIYTGTGAPWDEHKNDLPKGWMNTINPYVANRVVTADPSDPAGKTFYYYCGNGPGAAQGSRVWGLFYRSQDGGVTWTRGASGKFPAYAVHSSLAVNPAQPGDIWMAFARDPWQITGNPLYRSTDGGKSFSIVSNVNSCENVTFGKGTGSVPSVTIFGKVGGALKNAFYRSDDLGKTWIRISNYGLANVVDIEADPRTPGVLYVGTSGRGILYGQE